MDKDPKDVFLNLDEVARRLLVVSVAIGLLFVMLDSLQHHVKTLYLGEAFRSIYSIKYEASIGTWYSVMLAMVAACVAFLCFLEQRGANRRQALCWLVIALFFLYLSIDDQVNVHEQLGFAFKRTLVPKIFGGGFRLPSYGWQFIYGPFFGGMAVFLLLFTLKTLSSTRDKAVIIAALSLYGIAVFLDFWQGHERYFNAFSQAVGMTQKNATHWFRVVEEFLEILGTILFTNAFLHHLAYSLSLRPRRLIWR